MKLRVALEVDEAKLVFAVSNKTIQQFLKVADRVGRCEAAWTLLSQSITADCRKTLEKIVLSENGTPKGLVAMQISTGLLDSLKTSISNLPPRLQRQFKA